MKEDFLHYVWKYKKFDFSDLQTSDFQKVIIKKVGSHNISNSGPDFFNAQLIINDQLWAGTVEIHKKSSDWYIHNHEKDSAYDNVILHVVWEDDVEIFRKDNSRIPTIELKQYIAPSLLEKYEKLFFENKKNWIQCEKQIHQVPQFLMDNWQERLFFERLEQKSVFIGELLKTSRNDWETVLFQMLFKNFGLKSNGDAFFSVANSIQFSTIRKYKGSLDQLEALFLGQAGLLDIDSQIKREKMLIKEYEFIKHKHKLHTTGVLPVQFFRLRPPNFPTIRLSQLARLYANKNQLFKEIIGTTDLEDFYQLFSVETSEFWKNHYTFKKESKFSTKKISKTFIHLLLINTIIPIKFMYARSIGKNVESDILSLIAKLPPEDNAIVRGFKNLQVAITSAQHSQAMLQQKNNYCDKSACLQCGVGNYLLDRF